MDNATHYEAGGKHMHEEEGFDGFITEDGRPISIKETEKVSAIFLRTAKVENAVGILRHLIVDCLDAGYLDAAAKYAEKMLPLLDAPDEKAECFLTMGRVMEQLRKFTEAEGAYARAFDLPQESNDTWYFLNNNRAYCLNQIGQHQEAEEYCRTAIEIQPKRHNAYKNLGIALIHLGRHGEAVENLVLATRLCPADTRALAQLDELFTRYRDIIREMPDFPAQLLKCHELVQRTHGKPATQ
jgi:tetratricopeptide (TPR) repeat protein